MAKQVWQVEDGGIFDTKAEALEWEASEKQVRQIMDECNVDYIDHYQLEDVVRHLLYKFKFVPK